MSNTGDTKVTESPKLDVARPDMGMEDGGNREAAAANDTAAKSKGNGGPMGNGKNTASKERASRKQEAADGTATLEPGPERVGKRQEKAARMAEGARRYLQSHGEEGPPSRRSPRSAKHDENGASAKHEETRASAKHDETGTSAKHDGTETSPKVAPIKASSSEKDLTISSNPSAAAKGKAKPVTSAVPSEALAEEDLPQAVRAAFRAQAAAQAQALSQAPERARAGDVAKGSKATQAKSPSVAASVGPVVGNTSPNANVAPASPPDAPPPLAMEAAAASDAEPTEEEPFEDPLASCLSFLSKLYGHAYSEMQLRAGIPLEQNRLSMEGMVQSAERIGFEVMPEQCRLSKVPPLALPAILLLEDGRACVMLRFSSKSAVEIFDPRGGSATTVVPITEIEKLFVGTVAYVRPLFRFDARSEICGVETPRSWFWGALVKNWWIYGHAVLATLLVNILAVASPIFVMTVYDRVVPNNAIETLWVLAIGIAGVAVFDFILRTLRGYLIDVAGKRLDVNLGSRLFDQVVRLRMDSRNSSAGSLASIMREFDFLRDFMSSATVTAIGDLPFIFLFILVIYLISGPVAYVPMVAVPIVLLVSLLIQIPLHRVTMRSMKEVTQKNAHLFEVLHGIETLKAIRAEAWAQRQWEQLVGLTAISSMKMKMLSQIGTNITMTAQLMVTVGIIVVGVNVLKEGDMTQGALIAAVLLSSRVMAPLAQVAGVLVRYEQTKAAFTALQGIMDSPVERPPEKKLVHKPILKGDIEFKEVSFNYPTREINALHGISFTVKAGEHVAIIGRVGSGKSTTLKLVQHLYEPKEGFVRVDDLDTRQIELSDLRRQVGYTPQDTVLFHGSIRENLVQGAPHATDEQVMRAADLAGLGDMIKQSPKGFDQEVGEHGTLLSGGQRQMIVLARALVLDPPILLLDEPTSHMDNYSERQFITKMEDWLKGRTMVLVTHRATLLSLVDRLIVMDKGLVVADGPKEEVLSALAAGKIGASAA